MFALDRIIHNLSESELREAYDEFVELGNTGILKSNGIVRQVDAEFRSEIPNQQFSITVLERAFLDEIARRYYKIKI